MLPAEFQPLIGKIWDPKHGGFDRKYFTDGRISAIYAEFKSDHANVFAEVVETIVRKFRTTPTVEQFAEIGSEIRAKRREREAAETKKEFSKAHQQVTQVSFKDYVKSVVGDPSRKDELAELVNVYGLARLERATGEQLPLGVA